MTYVHIYVSMMPLWNVLKKLNVFYKLKNREGLLPAGFTVAKNQLTLNDYKAPSMDLKTVETTNVATVVRCV